MSKDYPDFHKKNILKRETEAEESEKRREYLKMRMLKDIEEMEDDYPIKRLSIDHQDESYPELDAAVEYYNQGLYSEALKIFNSRPPDPARFFKNLVCTFHGPIGWLLMFNTKAKKDAFLRFCIASCEYNLGSFSAALETIKDDNTEECIYLKAWCQYRLDMHKESRENFQKAFSINPRLLLMYYPYKEKEAI